MRKVQLTAKIRDNRLLSGRYYKLTLDAGIIAKSALPGQFVMVKAGEVTDPLLRRPLSVYGAGRYLELLYEVVGRGTKLLSQMKAGESLDLLGPLGNGFDIKSSKTKYRPLFVAGGIGVAPLVFLAFSLSAHRKFSKKRPMIALIGGRTSAHVLCAADLRKAGCDVRIATDDGSRGYRGRVTGLLEEILRLPENDDSYLVYGCGPKPMLKAVSDVSSRYNVPAQISLESHMACGIGACLGCVVSTKSGYRRVCKDGPVFSAGDIVW